jgi:hypothetical protein
MSTIENKAMAWTSEVISDNSNKKKNLYLNKKIAIKIKK